MIPPLPRGLPADYPPPFSNIYILPFSGFLRAYTTGHADLSSALAENARRERYLAIEIQGRRHDLDLHYGLLATQLALGLAGKDRDEVLTLLVDLLAQSQP